MPVTSSTFSSGSAQVDGRYWITETQTLDTGTVQTFVYLADPGTDAQAVANARAVALNAAEQAALTYVPSRITAMQARRAINAAGIRAQVEAAVSQGSADVQTLWYTADFLDRSDPALAALAPLVPLTSDQVDNLFRKGITL